MLKGDGDFLPKDCPEVSKGECERCPDETCENHPADTDCFAVVNQPNE